MDLHKIVPPGVLPQKKAKFDFLGLALDPLTNKGPKKGLKQVFSLHLDNDLTIGE